MEPIGSLNVPALALTLGGILVILVPAMRRRTKNSASGWSWWISYGVISTLLFVPLPLYFLGRYLLHAAHGTSREPVVAGAVMGAALSAALAHVIGFMDLRLRFGRSLAPTVLRFLSGMGILFILVFMYGLMTKHPSFLSDPVTGNWWFKGPLFTTTVLLPLTSLLSFIDQVRFRKHHQRGGTQPGRLATLPYLLLMVSAGLLLWQTTIFLGFRFASPELFFHDPVPETDQFLSLLPGN